MVNHHKNFDRGEMIKSTIRLGLIFVALGSCGQLSTNQISQGTFILSDGYFQGQFLKEKLVFHRVSWFKEATLIYDVRIAPLSEKSAYFQWFSPESQEDIKACSQFYVALFYAKSSKYISHRLVLNQLESQGAEIQVIPDFGRSLRMHPQFERETLQLYRMRGVCFKRPKSEAVILGLPGYPSQVMLPH